MFEAKRRSGLCVLDYVVTSNHIHLLVKDTSGDVIAESMQLIAGRTAQDYNQRKGRKVAFWEDRYHATAIEADEHLHRCLSYIDLNMVRAGVVSHPGEWSQSGFREIQKPPKRYGIINLESLSESCGFGDLRDFQRAHRELAEQGLENGLATRDDRWSEAIAVGGWRFVENVKIQLGGKAGHRGVVETDSRYVLRQSDEIYSSQSDGKMEPLSTENSLYWNEDFVAARR